MDMDLADLMSALTASQQVKASVKLSDRNVVELVNKLKQVRYNHRPSDLLPHLPFALAFPMQLGILDPDDLMHTITGKEYITKARLKQEVKSAIAKAGGRLPLVEMPALIGVDLVSIIASPHLSLPSTHALFCPQAHCERQARLLVEESGGEMSEVQGEIISNAYFDGLAAEVNEILQESGVILVADLALQVSSYETRVLLSSRRICP